VLTVGVATTASADDGVKRARPDYDGRGNHDAHDESAALWIPRVVFSPFYFVTEYGLRRPIGAAITVAERDRWVDAVTNVFTFGPSNNYLIVPTALFDFGLLPSIGIYFAGDDMFHANNSVRLYGATGGLHWLTASALDRYNWNNNRTSLSGRVEFTRRPDLLFYGIGPDTTDDHPSRYSLQRIEGSSSFRQGFLGESYLALGGGVRAIAFRSDVCCTEPSIAERIAAGTIPPPPGYGTDYTVAFGRAALVLDTRDPRPAPATGSYLRLHGELDSDVRNDRKWLSYGGNLGVAVDLNGRQRTMKFQIGADFVDPTGSDIVPFTELVQLGSDMMPGFVNGWMTGRSTAVAQLGYTWPVWVYLDGHIRMSAGNAFGPHLEDFSVKKLRLSWDVGVTSVGARDNAFEILFGLGTETIENGASISSVRLTFGSRRGF
jgi:hypothetical protein